MSLSLVFSLVSSCVYTDIRPPGGQFLLSFALLPGWVTSQASATYMQFPSYFADCFSAPRNSLPSLPVCMCVCTCVLNGSFFLQFPDFHLSAFLSSQRSIPQAGWAVGTQDLRSAFQVLTPQSERQVDETTHTQETCSVVSAALSLCRTAQVLTQL